MIVTIKGCLIDGVPYNGDLSGFVDRSASNQVQATIGQRIDTLTLTLFDEFNQIYIPKRAEVIIYDYPAASLPVGWTGFPAQPPIYDQPPPNSAPFGYEYDEGWQYDTQDIIPARLSGGWASAGYAGFPYGGQALVTVPAVLGDGVGYYDTMPPLEPAQNPSGWTARLFGGYVSEAYADSLGGGVQRVWTVQAQDYTIRTKFTTCNAAYGIDPAHPLGWTDQQIIRDVFTRFCADVDVTQVQELFGLMPPISFPQHTLEQFLTRVVKVTNATYRIDYYKCVQYLGIGTSPAPFGISAFPNFGQGLSEGELATFPAENWEAGHDEAAQVNRVWVIGATFAGAAGTYTVAPAPDGTQWIFPLPAAMKSITSAQVLVNGADQGTVGLLGTDGTLTDPASWSYPILMGSSSTGQPPTLAFQTPPPAGAEIVVNADFQYPLVAVVQDPALVAAEGGVFWDAVVRDTRIKDQATAQQVALGHLAVAGKAQGKGGCTLRYRGFNGQLLQVGQTILCYSPTFFANFPEAVDGYLSEMVTNMTTALTDDTNPLNSWVLTVDWSDQPILADDDIYTQALSQAGRVNAALQQGDVDDIVEDQQTLADQLAIVDAISWAAHTPTTNTYNGTSEYDSGLLYEH